MSKTIDERLDEAFARLNAAKTDAERFTIQREIDRLMAWEARAMRRAGSGVVDWDRWVGV